MPIVSTDTLPHILRARTLFDRKAPVQHVAIALPSNPVELPHMRVELRLRLHKVGDGDQHHVHPRFSFHLFSSASWPSAPCEPQCFGINVPHFLSRQRWRQIQPNATQPASRSLQKLCSSQWNKRLLTG